MKGFIKKTLSLLVIVGLILGVQIKKSIYRGYDNSLISVLVWQNKT